jgi:hypothetical protein
MTSLLVKNGFPEKFFLALCEKNKKFEGKLFFCEFKRIKLMIG